MGGSTSSTTVNKEDPSKIALRNSVLANYANVDPNTGGKEGQANVTSWKPAPTSTQQQVAGLTPYHDQAAASGTQAATAYQPYLDQATTAANQTGQTYSGVLNPETYSQQDIEAAFNPYNEDVIKATRDSSDRNFAETIAKLKSGVAGQFGNSRVGVMEGQAASDKVYNDALQEAAMRQGGWQQAIAQLTQAFQNRQAAGAFNRDTTYGNNAQQSAQASLLAQLGGQAQQLGLTGATALRDIGNMYQSQQQRVYDAITQNARDAFELPFRIGTGLLGTFPAVMSSTTTTSGGNNAAGIGVSLLGSLLFSDPKAKKNIKKEDPEDILSRVRKLTSSSYDYNDKAQAMGASPGRKSGTMAGSYERAFSTELPRVGGMKAIPVDDVVGKLLVAVKGLEERTAHLGKDKRRDRG
jgi:hypothetical protein